MTSAKALPRQAADRPTVLYLRQSSDPNNDELAVARQRRDCERLSKQRGWSIDREFMDDDESASPEHRRKPRPAYELMLAQVRAGRVGRIVVQVADRLYRHPRDLEDLIDLCNMHQVALVTVSGDLDLSTDAGRLVARILGAVGRGEVERKSARQKLAATQRAEAGKPWWPSRPFAYTADPGPDGKWTSKNPIRKHPTEAELLKDAYHDVLRKTPLHTIAARWNAKGVTTPRGSMWRGAQVRQVLMAARNAGLIENHGEVVGQGTWPHIVSEEIYRGVVAVLSDPARRHGKTRGRKYLLSGIAVCGSPGCGQTVGSGIATSTGAANYMCKECFGVSRNAAKVDAVVIEAVVDRLSRDDAEELMHADDRPDTAELTTQRTALNERLKELGREYGRKPAAFIDAAVESITAQLEDIKAALTDADKAHIFEGVTGPDADKKFDKLDLDRQRAIINALVTVTINPTGRGRVFDRRSVDVVFRDES
jgi:DNA invertase Pin-like site-specific DNA recombinase